MKSYSRTIPWMKDFVNRQIPTAPLHLIDLMKRFLLCALTFALSSSLFAANGKGKTKKRPRAYSGCGMAFFDDPDYFSRDPWDGIRQSRDSEGGAPHFDESRPIHRESGDDDLSHGGYGGDLRDSEIYFK
jgi:hypothetical protein